jgi:hypothetical protein
MPAIDFPASPSPNDEYTFEGRTWLWNGTGWEVKAFVAPQGATGPVGATGVTGATGVNGLKGGSTDLVFFENDQTVTANYTITTNKNALSAGPITINSGVTVTIGSGQSWVIV